MGQRLGAGRAAARRRRVPYLHSALALAASPATLRARPGDRFAGQPAPARAEPTCKQRDQELEAIRAEQKQSLENEAGSSARSRRSATTAASSTAADRHRRARAHRGRRDRRDRGAPAAARRQRAGRCANRSRTPPRVIAEVLAALQRIGRRPPPALLVRPEDALQSVRTAMLLGAVLPEMRQADRGAGRRPRPSWCGCARRSPPSATSLDARSRSTRRGPPAPDLLVDERQKRQAEAESALAAERAARQPSWRARPTISRI